MLVFELMAAFPPQTSFFYFKPKEKSAYKNEPSTEAKKRSLWATESRTQTLFQNRKTPAWKLFRHFPKTKGTAAATL